MVCREEEIDTPEPLTVSTQNAVANSLMAISFGVIVGLVVLTALIETFPNPGDNDLWPCSEDLQSCPAASVSDSDLAQLYKFYKAAPSSSTAKDDATPPMLTTVDVLDGRVVRDAARVKFGRIEEILLSPGDNWKIAFLALSQFNGHKDENERLAVPLAAFVQLPAKTTFLLDIPEEARLLEQTFKVGDWPHKIERGWVEFTHVKYGAAATDGIQTVERTAEN